MDFFAAISGSLISIILFCMIVAGVLKLFQIGTLLTEIRDALQNQRRSNAVSPAPAAPTASGQWTPPPPAARPPTTADYPSYSAMAQNPTSTALETVPQVVRQPAPAPTQAYLSPVNDSSPTPETQHVALDEEMSGEEMLRALDVELRAEEACSSPSVIDTTVVSPHE